MAWKQQKQQIRISKKEKLTRYKNELKQKKKLHMPNNLK